MAKLWSQILFIFIAFFGHICALKFVKLKNIYGIENSNEIENACSEKDTKNWFIYCQGPILEAVNAHNLFPDSKDFVDSPLRKSPQETLKSFEAEFGNNSADLMEIDVKRLKQFIEEYFDPPGSELAICVPRDWEERPQTLLIIEDNSLREWALELNGIWRKLCKKINIEIIGKMDQFSLIYVPNEFIAPGGRFREFYYWDAYWIIRGLIASEMHESAKKMIQNLAEMVKRFGMVPNGGRVYYLRRSQPPLLAPMLFEYFQHTLDWTFLYQMLPILEMEIKFWDLERQIKIEIIENGTTATFGAYLYRAGSNVPRPESFKEDLNQSKGILDKEQRAFFFKSIASAAESGWDFSSRWLRDPQKLDTIETINILPVDLNSFICWNFHILEDLFMITKKYSKAKYYRNRKLEMQDLLELLFYNETTGVWHDYNLREQKHNTNFYPSIAMPLFTGCYDEIDERRSARLFEYMKVNGAFNFDGGIPTSMIKGTGEQWDFPNGWSPLNHIIIEGLRKSENAEMEEQAFKLAKKWVLANYKVFKETKQMWEKYNVNGEAEPGTGGEYGVQDGFGWTNGVILDLLITYRDRLSVEPTPSMNNGANDANWHFGCKLAITIICFTIFNQFLFKNHLFI